VRVKVGEQLREIWRQATGGAEGGTERERGGCGGGAQDAGAARDPEPGPVSGAALPKPTPVNLRRFAETPVVRRAINVIKDRIAAMDWQVRVRRGVRPGMWRLQ
jgi:hypothetical protein